MGLVGLLTALNDAVAQFRGWIRLMYAYPSNFTDEMVEALASLPHVVKYIDIPLQHASDSMLTSMRRNVSSKTQTELLDKLRDQIPGVAIRTTMITGFPGETEEDHQSLLDFIAAQKFDALGVFKYSAEDGTVAGTMENDASLRVSSEVKQQREEELMLLQQTIAFETAKNRAKRKCIFDVLLDDYLGESGEGELRLYRGRTYHQAPDVDASTIVMSEKELIVGELVRCTITDSDEYDMIARPTDELEKVVSLPLR